MKSTILLVEPPRTFWFVMGDYLPPPSSLLILAAYIEQELPGIDIEIVDCQADRLSWKNLERHIESADPAFVLTSGFTTNAYTCARTCEIAKTVNEDITTIVGGFHLPLMNLFTTFQRSTILCAGKGNGLSSILLTPYKRREK
jgi:anaerobic magnesium-protoporphyrin IX monomethyl ester cyclase